MNYNYSKKYGELVNSIAVHFLSSKNIYEGSLLLLKINEAHYLCSRLAFSELFLNYPENQKVITFVVDKYILSEAVKEFFLSKLYQNDDLEIEFIKRDIGDAYSILCHIQLLLQTMNIVAHPENQNEGVLEKALDMVVKPVIEKTEKNRENFAIAFESLAAKEIRQVKADKTKEPQSKYKIENEKLLLDIYKILQEQKIISNDVSFIHINKIVANGDASIIKPRKKWAFFIALHFMKDSISNHAKEWVADITKSLGIKQNALTQNKPIYEELYELLEETVKKNHK